MDHTAIAETSEIEMTAYTVEMSVKPHVKAFFDEGTNTISYIVQDPSSASCAIIDSVMDIDYAAGRITFEQADKLIQEIERRELTLEWIIETHVHADHLSAAPYIQERLGGKIGVGSKITVVQ
jgi:glyoxylase-like metal-dependent hydrolase (beta-lactamase superfamily II)